MIMIGGFLITLSVFIIGLNASSYGKLNEKFDEHLQTDGDFRVSEEHRLTKIEQTLLRIESKLQGCQIVVK